MTHLRWAPYNLSQRHGKPAAGHPNPAPGRGAHGAAAERRPSPAGDNPQPGPASPVSGPPPSLGRIRGASGPTGGERRGGAAEPGQRPGRDRGAAHQLHHHPRGHPDPGTRAPLDSAHQRRSRPHVGQPTPTRGGHSHHGQRHSCRAHRRVRAGGDAGLRQGAPRRRQGTGRGGAGSPTHLKSSWARR